MNRNMIRVLGKEWNGLNVMNLYDLNKKLC
jgi:hypothetical protein